jgi:hypothetical protein
MGAAKLNKADNSGCLVFWRLVAWSWLIAGVGEKISLLAVT